MDAIECNADEVRQKIKEYLPDATVSKLCMTAYGRQFVVLSKPKLHIYITNSSVEVLDAIYDVINELDWFAQDLMEYVLFVENIGDLTMEHRFKPLYGHRWYDIISFLGELINNPEISYMLSDVEVTKEQVKYKFHGIRFQFDMNVANEKIKVGAFDIWTDITSMPLSELKEVLFPTALVRQYKLNQFAN
jgi:hypothetical protein